MTFGGASLDVLGALGMKLKRNDGPIKISETGHDSLVLPELSNVAADVLLGADFTV